MDVDIYLVGLGIRGLEQLTREAEAALRRCSRVFYLNTYRGAGNELRALGINAVDLHECYSPLKDRRETYGEIVRRVMEAARQTPPVAFAVYGHPTVYVDPTRQIMERAPLEGLRVRTLPGISSMDTLFVDLAFDPARPGLQIFEASMLLIYKIPLLPQVPCLILQPGALESVRFLPGLSRPERFLRLKAHLLKFYPGEHEVKICTSALDPYLESKIVAVSLGDLENAYADLTTACTLFIPPCGELEPDQEMRELMTSEEHARSIFYPTKMEAITELKQKAAMLSSS